MLAADLEAGGHYERAERVLLAALALSEGLFGRDDSQSVATRQLLGAGTAPDNAGRHDSSRASLSSPRRDTPSFS